jgi:DNA-binding LacI/PurR family transcriptional regulator
MTMDSDFGKRLLAGMTARKMSTRPHWSQGAGRDGLHWIRNATHLLMHPGQLERPDGLIISDDNLVEYATAGLIDAGVKVPQDLDVVAHCNFPWPTPSVLPVQRLGYDARECLRICLDLLDRRRQGQTTESEVRLQACLAEELV